MLNKLYPKFKILCEPQMSKRGLYPSLSRKNETKLSKHYMNFLQYADGMNSLEKISKLITLNEYQTKKIFIKLKKNNLVY